MKPCSEQCAHFNTAVERLWGEFRATESQRKGREDPIDFPSLKCQFIILWDALDRSPAFSLFVIWGAQNCSKMGPLICHLPQRWRKEDQKLWGDELIEQGSSHSVGFCGPSSNKSFYRSRLLFTQSSSLLSVLQPHYTFINSVCLHLQVHTWSF